MKIEILENFKDGRDQYLSGEVRVVAEDRGAFFCGNGWAKDLDGKVATGDRNKAHGRMLDVQNLKHTMTTKSDGVDG